ncbi:Thioredoxin domain-containing protein [Aphelenchoides fujianensis]|nr:Thioredoxin domain-containing protein [Aphelenchoides fujianensis]
MGLPAGDPRLPVRSLLSSSAFSPPLARRNEMAELLAGMTLKRKDGSTIMAEELRGKVVAFYFSAHWCPPCRLFTPQLKDFYYEANKGSDDFEIVFFSFDRSDEDAESYVKESHGNWLYLLPSEDKVESISDKFGVEGIPALIVLKPDGSVITKGRAGGGFGPCPKGRGGRLEGAVVSGTEEHRTA